MDRQRKGRLMLLCMVIFFVTPIVVVIMMYKLDWRPQGSSVGELVLPPRLLNTQQTLLFEDGSAVPADMWKDKWSMLYIAESCESKCAQKLHDMRQLHVSLYKEIPRMQRVLITTSQQVSSLKASHPELHIINQPGAEAGIFSEQFNIGNESAMTADRIYLVDPLGNLMMSFSPETDPALIRKDIIRLMKYSWAG